MALAVIYRTLKLNRLNEIEERLWHCQSTRPRALILIRVAPIGRLLPCRLLPARTAVRQRCLTWLAQPAVTSAVACIAKQFALRTPSRLYFKRTLPSTGGRVFAFFASLCCFPISLAWCCARFEYFSPRRRSDLPFRLERSAKRQLGALSLLKVESTMCFQRKRRR